MTTRRVLAIVGLLFGICAASFVVIWTRPVVSNEQLEEAREEVERVRAVLDVVTCERPPLFGTAIDNALPLGEFFSVEGPFGECWRAAGEEPLRDIFAPEGSSPDEEAGDEFGTDPLLIQHIPQQRGPFDSNVLPTPIAEVMRQCGDLAAELARQARTPDRCTPVRPSSEAWQEQAADGESASAPFVMARATQVMARRMAMEDGDAALRLLVQAMATARDAGHGPSGFLQMMFSIAAEELLASTFQSILDRHDPSALARLELVAALDALESAPVDAHAVLTAEYVALYDATRAEAPLGQSTDERLFGEYSAATLLPRVMETCPPGITLLACAERFPFDEPEPATWLDRLLGPRAQAHAALGAMSTIASESIPRYLFRIETSRRNMRLLKILLRWADERSRGRCPETSDEEWLANPTEIFIARNTSGEYQLVGPAPAGGFTAFYFSCPMPDALPEEAAN